MYEKTELPSGRIRVQTPYGHEDCEDDAKANAFILKQKSAPPKTLPVAEPVVDLEPDPDQDVPPGPTR
jgi:hypothetical protein